MKLTTQDWYIAPWHYVRTAAAAAGSHICRGRCGQRKRNEKTVRQRVGIERVCVVQSIERTAESITDENARSCIWQQFQVIGRNLFNDRSKLRLQLRASTGAADVTQYRGID